ncbi:MAG: type IVB secretion system protein IcmJDotN [Gammaproteobacteria bacterium]
MKPYPLALKVIPGAWRLFLARKADKAFTKFSSKVFERDDYTCQFCGFQANQYQEVINIDQNYAHNKLSNLATACCFCTQCFFLEAVGKGEYGGGNLIYLPEITQEDLNGLCHVLFCAIANATDYRNDAQNIYRNLKLRSKIVENKLGEGMSNPSLVGQALLNFHDAKQPSTPVWLDALRLLPARAKFTKQIEAWAAAALDELSK